MTAVAMSAAVMVPGPASARVPSLPPAPGDSSAAALPPPAAPGARPPHRPPGAPLPAAWAKAYHPRHATRGVLALRGEPLSRRAARELTRPAAPKAGRRPQCPAPTAPGGVTAAAGTSQATVTWTPASGNGSTVTAYVVRAASGPDAGASIATGGGATTATVTGLAGGTAATFSVVAESGCGAGPPGTSPAVTPAGPASTYLGSVLAGAPAAFYRLDEPAGATVMADSSGSQADGAYSGQQALGQPPALLSDPAPATGYTTCCSGIGSAGPALPRYDGARTVEAWINTTSGQTNQAILGYGPASTDEAFVVSVSSQSVNVDGWNDYLAFPAPRPLNDGHWHLITVSYDGTTVTVYLDGQQMGSAGFAGTANTLDPSGMSLAGFPGYNMFSGQMADVAVFPAALSAATITAHFAASGYSRPGAPKSVSVFFGGANAADVTWGHATGGGGVTGYLVTARGGPGAPSVAVPGDATAARLSGLAAGTYTFQVVGVNPDGTGPPATTKPFAVTGTASTYASSVLSAAPSAFYRLADSAPQAMADSSGHGATGVYTPQATLSRAGPLASDPATAIGSAGNGPAAAGGPPLPLYAQPRTLEGWISTTSNSTQFVAAYGVTATSGGFTVLTQPSDVIVSGYNDDLLFTSPAILNDGSWHFVAVTATGTSATVYVDGTSLGTQTFRVPLNTLPSPQGLLIGSGVQGCCGYFSGGLADVAVFPSVLSAAQVGAEFAASGLGRPPAPGSPSATAGGNQATVAWRAPAGASPPVTGYLVTAMRGTTPANAVSVPASATTAAVTGLAGGAGYTFRIQALNEYGAGTAAATGAVTPTGPASAYVTTVLSSGPSVFYRLADGDRGAMADSSGHGALGAYTGQAALGQPGPLASDPAAAIGSNGNGPAAAGGPSLPLYSHARTLEGWISTTSGNSVFLAAYGVTSTGEGFTVLTQPSDVIVSAYNDDLTFTSPVTLNDGNWHFIVLTSTGTSATAYVDGISLGTQSLPAPLDTLPSPQGLLIGSSIQGCCGFSSAGLADVAVFPSALTAAQVAAQFAASGEGRPPAPSSPVATPGVNQATVSWQAPSGASPPVSGYLVTAMRGSTPVNSVSVPASASSTTVTGLAGGTPYTFGIQALNTYGAGPPATTAAVTPAGAAASYASTVLASGPSVFYRLADADRGAMADSSGHGATGAYTAQPALGQPGPLAGDPAAAIGPNGNGPAGSGHPSLPLYAQPRTLEGWISTTSNGTQLLAGYGSQAIAQGFDVAIQPHTVIVSGYSDDLSFTSPAALNDGNWHFIVATTNGTSATAYVDGSGLGSKVFHTALDTLATPQGLEIGAGPQGCCGSFAGGLADIAVFPSVLSAAQVTATFAASGLGRPPAPTSPVATAGANQATVSWQAPAGADPPVTGYLITAMRGTTAVNSVSVPAAASSTTVTGLAGGTAYTFGIRALNTYGAGTAAATSPVTPSGAAATYVSAVLSSGPSVFYRLADTGRGAMADSSGHGATGAYTAQPTLGQPGPLVTDQATAIGSNGNGPAASGNPSLPLYSRARTLEGWINTTSGGENIVASYGVQNTAQGFSVATEPSSVIVSGYGDDLSFATTSALNNGAWHFIVVTTTGTSATGYVDGTSLGTQNFPATLDTLPSPAGLLIGAGVQGCCGSFSGGLADIAVFPSALTAAQVAAQWSASGDTARRHSPAVMRPAHRVRATSPGARPARPPLPASRPPHGTSTEATRDR